MIGGVETMAYTIYGEMRSSAFSVEAGLAEAGAAYDFVHISLDRNEQKAPAFLALNPAGKVPALRLPDGSIVTESAALLLLIAERFSEARLLPEAGSAARAMAYRWLLFFAGEIYPMVEISDYPERFTEQTDALRAKARERIRERLLLAERQAAGPWFLESGFSLVDVYAANFTRWRGSIGGDWLDEGHIPKLDAIARAVAQRSKIAPVWARHFGGL
jgi:GST-like protein